MKQIIQLTASDIKAQEWVKSQKLRSKEEKELEQKEADDRRFEQEMLVTLRMKKR